MYDVLSVGSLGQMPCCLRLSASWCLSVSWCLSASWFWVRVVGRRVRATERLRPCQVVAVTPAVECSDASMECGSWSEEVPGSIDCGHDIWQGMSLDGLWFNIHRLIYHL